MFSTIPAVVVASTDDGTLAVADGPRALEVRAESRRTPAELRAGSCAGRWRWSAVGRLKGLVSRVPSLWTNTEQAGVHQGRSRRAHLARIGLVDQAPSYAGSRVELRAKLGRTVSASDSVGQETWRANAVGRAARFAEFVGEAMAEAFDSAFLRPGQARGDWRTWANYDAAIGQRVEEPGHVAPRRPHRNRYRSCRMIPTVRAVIAASEIQRDRDPTVSWMPPSLKA